MASKAGSYFGGNATRGSVVQNPAAYAHDQGPMFGVREFRKFGFASEATRDAVADKQMSAGYTRKKNPLCPTCFVQMPVTKVCQSC